MNIETLRNYCLSKPGANESFPFGEDTLVFKVGGKVFALTSMDARPLSVNLKCNPELAVELREQYDAVRPGYHMNKVHWNTVIIDGTVRESDLKKWIDHSYELIVASLPKAVRHELEK
ncbi:MmcQ/YjbR family DNA-binding protein [Larkinella humicola]|uniref:MmcQ/YjbR family DNA-binding protein n=1 Tax=Larkinella humicola TaxID=2607654 RepID=A0A5N1JM68_9BACT|nr:MmcQ/YjbR family DNA-binding protein [Larkinella humicola]KAA9356636.1 MmcQ/YjbR family DNA-binding protein [Larkinella humicola]